MLTRKLEPIPAIDVLEGRVVRLREGKREEVTIEGGDPVELARLFAAEGALRLHVVDLDGAFTGTPSLALVETLAAAVELPRGIRINAVSPTVLVEATAYHPSFPGFTQVSAAAVGQAYVKAVEGFQTGQVYALDGQ